MLVGLISDTHGLMRAEALAALHGVELILHAGDVGSLSVLRELESIAPVHAVYGNVDDPLFGLPQRLALRLGGLKVHVSHGHELGSPTPEKLSRQYTADIIVFGHTHKPVIQTVGATLVVNPGAAGPRRFSLQPSVALLTIQDRHPTVTLMNVRE
ncbi:MAG: metallophosphoesterase family protein [Vicinamibacterales bacterium]